MWIGCGFSDPSVKKTKKTNIDSFNFNTSELMVDSESVPKMVNIDTSTLKGKRENIMRNFLINKSPSNPDFDTLIDLNYDNHLDYVIAYYGLSGTGFKKRIEVYLYKKENNRYEYNDLLSNINNPTFYIKEKKITGFYIGNGGGNGIKLEWIDNWWKITKIFTVENKGKKHAIWKIEYPLKHQKDSIILPFQMIPPQVILETDIKD